LPNVTIISLRHHLMRRQDANRDKDRQKNSYVSFRLERASRQKSNPQTRPFVSSYARSVKRTDFDPHNRNVLLVDGQMRDENVPCMRAVLLSTWPFCWQQRNGARNEIHCFQSRSTERDPPSSVLECSTRRLSRQVSRTVLERVVLSFFFFLTYYSIALVIANHHHRSNPM